MTPARPCPLPPSNLLDARPDPRGLPGLVGVGGEGEPRPLPLRMTRVRATVVGFTVRTTIEQELANPYAEALDVTYIFPLAPTAAVIGFELVAGDRRLHGECRERGEAERSFAAAAEAGHRAALLTAERADVHTLVLAAVPPHTAVTARLEIVERLEMVDGRWRWRFPTTVAPRFMPGQAISHDGPGTTPDTDLVPDASRLTPPLRLAGGTRLDLEVTLAGPIRHLESSLHALRLDLEDGSVRVAPSGQPTLDRDFVLAFATGEPERAALRAWTDGTHTAALVEPPLATLASTLPRDAVFVVDISGSMQGAKLAAAQRALSGALHGLVAGDRFQLLAFDDRVERFADELVPYDDASLARADAWISGLHARGGTVMLPALQAALAGSTSAGRLRTVLFVTDGQAGDESQLLAAVANRRGQGRVFTLGIDTAVNAGLLERLARVGGGTCELCAPSDDIEGVVARLEARFGSPLADGIAVAASGGGQPFDAAAPDRPAALFSGRPAMLLLAGSAPEVTARATTPAGFAVTATTQSTVAPLGVFWARERIAWLEDRLALRPFEEEALRAEILRLALGYRLASRFTAFVAIDDSVTSSGERRRVVQPVELPATWDREAFLGSAAGMPQAPPPPLPAPLAMPSMAAVRTRMAEAAPRPGAAPSVAAKLAAPLRALGRAFGGPAVDAAVVAAGVPGGTLAGHDPAGRLARSQQADGSWGADSTRTAAALLALVLLRHTRHVGDRRRVVVKAAQWLASHRGGRWADLALAALEAAEAGTALVPESAWRELAAAGGDEGAALLAALEGST